MESFDKHKMIVESILIEYREMKSESVHKLQIQITMVSLYLTVFGVLLTIALNKNIDEGAVLLSPYFFCCLIPCVMIFIAILWLDQVYRQIKIAIYISFLEKKVNNILGLDNTLISSALFWEQWMHLNTTTKERINISQLFYYICLGVFFLCPVLSCLAGAYLSKWAICNFIAPLSITIVGYLIFLFFSVLYIIRILQCDKLVFHKVNSSAIGKFSKEVD